MSHVWRVFTGAAEGPGDVCAGTRWMGPHLERKPTDALALEALLLAEQMSAATEAMWLWWVSLRRPDLVDDRSFSECEALPADFRQVLLWVAGRGRQGVPAYTAAAAAHAPYQQALRSLSRAVRDYPSLAPVVSAVRAGRADLHAVLAGIPGGWDSAALRAHRTTVNEAVEARAAALEAGVGPDLPPLVLPRFSGLNPDEQSLCTDLTAGLPGSRGVAIESRKGSRLAVRGPDLGWSAVLSHRLRDRDLPVEVVRLDASYWGERFGAPADDVSAYFAAREPLARLSDGLHDALQSAEALQTWFASCSKQRPAWGPAWEAVLDKIFAGCREHGLSGVLLELWEDVDVSDARARLKAALDTADDPELSLIALTRRLASTQRAVSRTRKALSWA